MHVVLFPPSEGHLNRHYLHTTHRYSLANGHQDAGGELVYEVYKEEQGKDVNPKINVKLEANKS